MNSISCSDKVVYPILRLRFGYARYECEINELVSFSLKEVGGGWSVIMKKNREVVICTYCLFREEAMALLNLVEEMRGLPPGELAEWPVDRVCSEHNTSMMWTPKKESASQKRLTVLS